MASTDVSSVCHNSIINSSMLTDSYFGGLGSVTYIANPQSQDKPNNNVGLVKTRNLNLQANKQDDDLFSDTNGLQSIQKGCDQGPKEQRHLTKGVIPLIETKPVVTNINTTAEYNTWYKGLSILPWEDFVANPRKLNDLFYSERNENITYDPDEVNVFFHGKNVMAPVLGDVSENGKSWNIVVKTQKELSQIRSALTGRVSVFGVTLVYKEKGQSQPLRGTDMKCINLNGCVQRWCKRVLLTECCAVGAKLVITSGEEYESLVTAENIVCCIFCFPVWFVQTAIYKLHRVSTYDDFKVRFDSDDLFLHGAFQDAVCQRQEIFQISKEGDVFRTKAMSSNSHGDPQNRVPEMTVGQDNHKFVCIKKYPQNGEDGDGQIIEYETTTFQEIILRRKTKVLSKVKREKSHTKEDEKKPEVLDSESTIVKTPYVEKQTDTNDFEGDESESDDTSQIPVIASSIMERQTQDKTEFTLEGSGSFFMKSQETLSPTLKEMHENKADASDTVLHTFREESSSDDSDESFSPEHETDKTGKMRETEDVRKEILRISQTLPALKEDRYKSKTIEKVVTDEMKKEKKATRTNGKYKKMNIKKCIKDLMKTTEYREDMPELPSKNDARYAASVKPKFVRNLVTTEKDSNTSGNDKANISEDAVHAMHNNAKSSSDSDNVEETSQGRVTTDVEHFDENLFTDDKLDVINPPQERINNYNEVIELDSEINESKRVFEEKENIDKVDSFLSQMQDLPNRKHAYKDGPCEYVNTGDKVFQTNPEFKLRNDLSRGFIDKTPDRDLHEASISPVGQTKWAQRIATSDSSQSKLEADLEICDSDGDIKEYIPTLTTQPSGKLIEIGMGPGTVGSLTRVRKGRSKYDSTRKYLGERVPKKKNK
ncbi:hypothetical protein ACJMK2_031413 [Sinanodonta woodiana]|uniref:Uncharacterized protein n=1 Tax=Sinanodonta woodiana TaxID=1069815 RepID=A0ABD3X2N5_SINWO